MAKDTGKNGEVARCKASELEGTAYEGLVHNRQKYSVFITWKFTEETLSLGDEFGKS